MRESVLRLEVLVNVTPCSHSRVQPWVFVLLTCNPLLSGVNHGTFLHLAHEEGLILNSSIHAGIRAPMLRRKGDLRNDIRCGFKIIKSRDLDRRGTAEVIKTLKERVGDSNVYISIDIDVLDPAFAPGTLPATVGPSQLLLTTYLAYYRVSPRP
jgi:arginase family enzyme